MTEEKEAPKGLKFTINDGGQAQQPTQPETKKEEKLEEEKEDAITNTKSGTRRKG